MAEEFVTSYGKVVLERDIVFIRNVDVPFTKTAFAKIAYELAFLVFFILQFFANDGSRRYVGIAIWGILLLFHLPAIYDVLMKRSFSNRIPLKYIKDVTTQPDNFGLQTFVRLQLSNNRYRIIAFRTLEKQYEQFTAVVSENLHQPQFA